VPFGDAVSFGGKIQVLLVEDNPTDLLFAQSALTREQRFEVTVAKRLKHALKELEERPFDLVVLDLGLPDSQGLPTLVEIRRHSRHTPVVVMTASDDNDTALLAMQEGAQDYII
jgi:DNA-binding response OmpR family regulator